MTFKDLIAKKHFTVYGLSKNSGVPRTTIINIINGTSNIWECTARTLFNLSSALGVTMEDLLKLDKEETSESCPEYLMKSIKEYQKELALNSSNRFDCLDQLFIDIDSAYEKEQISKEQYDSLMKRFEIEGF